MHFAFPADTDFCFGRLLAHFEGYTTEGVVKERQKAIYEYRTAVAEGHTVALATVSASEMSVIDCKLGNLPPQQTVTVEFEICCELRVSTLSHWLLRLPSHISPRYDRTQSLKSLFDQLFGNADAAFFTGFKWDFELELHTSEDITECSLHGEPSTVERLSDRHYRIRLA